MNGNNLHQRLCEIQGCRRKHKALGLCLNHYMQWLRYYNPHRALLTKNRFCSTPNCGRMHEAKGLCKKCYVRSRSRLQHIISYKYSYYTSDDGKAKANITMNIRRTKSKLTDITVPWLVLLRKTTKTCAICNQVLEGKVHLDHIKPIAIGGTHTKNNVRYVHGTCNLRRARDGSDLTSENTTLKINQWQK